MDNLVSHADYFVYADAKINRLETSLAALQTENAELKIQVTGWKYNWNESTDREIELKKHIKRLCQAIAACTTDKGES